MTTILRVDASARHQGSTTRRLADRLIDQLTADQTGARILHRDLAVSVPTLLSEAWVGANFTDEAARTPEQRAVLAESDALIDELVAADTLVLATPIYNFGVPAALKAWIDLVARARKTFRYTESGPEGLLTGKRAFIVLASGGTQVGSAIDFASGYLRHVLGFLGITEVTLIHADRQMADSAALDRAESQIIALRKAA